MTQLMQHKLQKEVFLPSEEHLRAAVQVVKVGRKKKPSYLCIAVTSDKPVQAIIYQVKKAEHGEKHKKKNSWPLRQLKVLDGIDGQKDVLEFDMYLDKSYRWIASCMVERNTFIQWLYKLSKRFSIQKPEFKNVPQHLIDDAQFGEAGGKKDDSDDTPLAQSEEDYQVLSAKEEEDITMLMEEYDDAIKNAERFVGDLQHNLSVLDGANIHSIMGSEEQVLELMKLIDHGIDEACRLEGKLDDYDKHLQGIKEQMDVMREKDVVIQNRSRNHQALLEEVNNIVTALDVDHAHMKALIDADLSTADGVRQCSEAAAVLQRAVLTQLHPALEKMSAVTEQRKRFVKLSATLSQRFLRHMNNLFIHQSNEMSDSLMRQQTSLKLNSHVTIHRELLPYEGLMKWLRTAEPKNYDQLKKVYQQSFSKQYDHEIREFIEQAKNQFALKKVGSAVSEIDSSVFYVSKNLSSLKRGGGTPGRGSAGPASSLQRALDAAGQGGSLSAVDAAELSPDLAQRARFDQLDAGSGVLQLIEHVLSELGPVCLSEQDFCVRFFHLLATEEQSSSEEKGSATQQRQSVAQREVNAAVRDMMQALFSSLDSELNQFIAFGDKVDNFNSLYMLVRMSNHVIHAQDTGSFLSKVYGNCLVCIKRNFDSFVRKQVQAIEDCKLPKKGKVGIIPFVHQFEINSLIWYLKEFARQSEVIYKGCERRLELDKAYVDIVTTVYNKIQRLAMESVKTPKDVVLFENYHRILDVLSQLKIACLESQRKEARLRYQEHLLNYVTSSLGRPLEKLNMFFDGIEEKIKLGVKAEEISYQLAYSKQELRKIISMYPSREVKRGLEALYKKVEKHLCEEENLLQVVWHSMQDEFLKQYKYFEEMLAKCYPASGVTLDFTIENLLDYFSEIARSH